jgi:putative FmdB family regulatory protein
MDEIATRRPVRPVFSASTQLSWGWKRREALEGRAMPVYEFRCTKCEHVFEVMGSYAEREKAQTCPRCSSTEVKQAISLFSAKPPSGSF